MADEKEKKPWQFSLGRAICAIAVFCIPLAVYRNFFRHEGVDFAILMVLIDFGCAVGVIVGGIKGAVVGAAILVPIALIYSGANVYNHLDDAYAQWGAANMVIDYMRDNDGEWPPDWDALAPYFAKNNGRVVGWSYANFQAHVYIDFTADAERLQQLAVESQSVPFDVIHATSMFGPQFGDGPNGMLFLYFRDGDRNGG